MDIVLPSKYLSFSQSNDFYNLCLPLLLNSDIGFVMYYRAYSDGSQFQVTSDNQLNKYFLLDTKKKYMGDVELLDTLFSNSFVTNNRVYLFSSDIGENDYCEPLYKAFNIKSSFHIIEKFDDYYEGFWFLSKPGKTNFGFFINQQAVLEDFILYIRERGEDIAREGYQNRFFWSNQYPEFRKFRESIKAMASEKNRILTLKESFKPKRYPLHHKGKSIFITEAETNCLKHLGNGLSYKAIGNILEISSRTVEEHIRNIKNKLNISTLDQLLKIYHDNSLSNL